MRGIDATEMGGGAFCAVSNLPVFPSGTCVSADGGRERKREELRRSCPSSGVRLPVAGEASRLIARSSPAEAAEGSGKALPGRRNTCVNPGVVVSLRKQQGERPRAIENREAYAIEALVSFLVHGYVGERRAYNVVRNGQRLI